MQTFRKSLLQVLVDNIQRHVQEQAERIVRAQMEETIEERLAFVRMEHAEDLKLLETNGRTSEMSSCWGSGASDASL